MSDLFTDKIKLAFRSCQFHIQGIIPYHLLDELSVSLFNLQTKGILIELIILMENENKSIKITNTLLRIAAGGGQIYCSSDNENKFGYFINIDKKIHISANELTNEIETNVLTRITNGILNFQDLKAESIPIVHQSGNPQIHLTASKEWVKTGEKITLSWEVFQAESVILMPLNLRLPPKGSYDVQINMDYLFSIQAQNDNAISEKRIFVKALKSLGLSFSLYISTDKLKDYIPLHAHPEIPFHYAIPPACHLRLYWEADRMGILNEEKWGEIPANGFRDIQFKEDSSLHFTWKTIFETKNTILHFYILQENQTLPSQKQAKKLPSFLKFFEKRP